MKKNAAKEPPNTHRIICYVDNPTYEAVRRIAYEHNVKMTYVIRAAIQLLLVREPKKGDL